MLVYIFLIVYCQNKHFYLLSVFINMLLVLYVDEVKFSSSSFPVLGLLRPIMGVTKLNPSFLSGFHFVTP
jgi:hypothetical protein